MTDRTIPRAFRLQILHQRQKRQADDGEEITLDPIHQENAWPFDLVGSDTAQNRLSSLGEILADLGRRQRAQGDGGRLHMPLQHHAASDQRVGAVQPVRTPGQSQKRAARLFHRRRLVQEDAIQLERLVGSHHEAPRKPLRNIGTLRLRQDRGKVFRRHLRISERLLYGPFIDAGCNRLDRDPGLFEKASPMHAARRENDGFRHANLP